MSEQTLAEPGPENQVHEIRCAEIWGGTSAQRAEIRTPGIMAALHSTASGEANGGDIYYLSVCKYESLTRIAIADVRGHGDAAAQVSRWLYQALEHRMNHPNGARVLSELNQIAHKQGFQAITTAVVATFHREKRTLTYSYAGHPPLYLGQPGNVRPLAMEQRPGLFNLPLGALPKTEYALGSATVTPGDRLFAYTDGVTECGPDEDSFYGPERLEQFLDGTSTEPLPQVRDRLAAELTRQAGGQLLHDDCTFLAAEVLPAPPRKAWWFWKA